MKKFNNSYDNADTTDIKFLRPKDLQEKLGVGRERAYALMRTGGFPSIRIGRSYMVTEAALKEWLKCNEGRSINL